MKNLNDPIGNQNRDLPACSAMPQPTTQPRIQYKINPFGLLRSLNGISEQPSSEPFLSFHSVYAYYKTKTLHFGCRLCFRPQMQTHLVDPSDSYSTFTGQRFSLYNSDCPRARAMTTRQVVREPICVIYTVTVCTQNIFYLAHKDIRKQTETPALSGICVS